MVSKINRKNIFLIDGMGALTTAALLTLLLGSFTMFFGVAENVLYILAVVAAGFAVYSFTCHFLVQTNRLQNAKVALVIIALLNLSYCVVTASLVFALSSTISIWGVLYFVGEILLIIGLAIIELRLARLSS